MLLNKRILQILCSVLLLSLHGITKCQYQSPDIIQTLDPERIPVDNQNWEITQSPLNGFMYIANSTGLVEFNGLSSQTYKLPSGQGIRSVYAGIDGTVYTGSFEDFGRWTDNGKGGMKYESLAEGIVIPKNDEIWNILEYRQKIFFQSFTTIYALSGGKVTIIRAPAIMLFMFPLKNGFVVQALGKGMFYFDGTNFTFIHGSELFSSVEVLSVIERSSGDLWLCTANNGIYNYDQHTFRRLDNEVSDALGIFTCNAGVAVNDSVFAFGTILNGILYCNDKGKVIKTYNYSNGLNNNTVLSLYKDRDQNIWAGLDEGLNCIPTSKASRLFSDKNGKLGTIYSLYRQNNMIYFGTNHGLFAADITESNGEYEFSDLNLLQGTQGQVWKLFEHDGSLFCGHNEGTFLVKGRSVSGISDVTGGWCFTGFHDVLLQGTYTGIVVFRKNKTGQWQFSNRISGFSEPTRFLEVDYLGYVWAVHNQKGLYRLEIDENADSVMSSLQFTHLGTPYGKINITRLNNQVVFLNTWNIFSFDAENRKFFSIKALEEGLGEYRQASRIIPQDKNRYWFILEDKIALFEISRSFSPEKIMELHQRYTDLPGREQQIIALDQFNLLIPTRQAFAILNMQKGIIDTYPNPPLITRILFAGKKDSILYTGGKPNLSVSAKRNNVTVYMADPAYGKGEKEIMYRIAEVDPEWRMATNDNFTFLNLHSGTYTIEIRSSASGGITSASFHIRRPWYVSIAAIIAYFVLLALAIFTGIRIFRAELRRQKQLLEYRVRKSRLENELDYKSFELMLTMRYLIRKTEILKELQNQIDLLKDASAKYPVKFVREMEKIISEGLDSQTEEWKTVMNNLKLSQEGFFRKLKEKYPNLTPNDLRLCSYLRMNFSTKEIAHLLNISGRAVEIGRYRLRTKMRLDHAINLTEYLIAEAEN